jgi:hypothetical protein
MTRSSLIPRLVGTTALVRTFWLLLLFPLSQTAAHKVHTRICDHKDMPTVVLAKDKGTGIFTVLERYAIGEMVPDLSEWTWDPNVRFLERSDYDAIPSPSTKGQRGGLRPQQPNDPFPGLDLMMEPHSSSSSSMLMESFDPSDHRFLEVNQGMGGDNPSSNDTLSDILEDFDLLYAR